jgi:LPS sulfotransferase NodH
LLDTENGNLAMLNTRGLPFHNLQYETMVRDRLGTIRRFATALGVPFDPAQFSAPPRDELQKIGDDWNQEAEQRFRQDNAAYLAAVEARRAIKKAVAA